MVTIMDIPVPIHLPVGLTKTALNRWRDSLCYVVIGKKNMNMAVIIFCLYYLYVVFVTYI